jgi:hypothetical protein
MSSKNTRTSFIGLLRGVEVTTRKPIPLHLQTYTESRFQSSRIVHVPEGISLVVDIENNESGHIPLISIHSTCFFLTGTIKDKKYNERIVYQRIGLTEAMFKEDFLIK